MPGDVITIEPGDPMVNGQAILPIALSARTGTIACPSTRAELIASPYLRQQNAAATETRSSAANGFVRNAARQSSSRGSTEMLPLISTTGT